MAWSMTSSHGDRVVPGVTDRGSGGQGLGSESVRVG